MRHEIYYRCITLTGEKNPTPGVFVLLHEEPSEADRTRPASLQNSFKLIVSTHSSHGENIPLTRLRTFIIHYEVEIPHGPGNKRMQHVFVKSNHVTR